jgi:hypothetical protein
VHILKRRLNIYSRKLDLLALANRVSEQTPISCVSSNMQEGLKGGFSKECIF